MQHTGTFAVIGLGRFGQSLCRALVASGAEVIAIDRVTRAVEQMRDVATLAVRLDAMDAEALKSQGVHHVDVAVVGVGENFESAAMAVATLHELGVKRIVARAENDIQAQILRKVGASEIVQPEHESAFRWAHRLTLSAIHRYIELGEAYSIIYMTAPQPFHDRTLAEIDLRNEYGVNLIAIERRVAVQSGADNEAHPSTTTIVPTAGTAIRPDDVLIVVGSNESLRKLPGG